MRVLFILCGWKGIDHSRMLGSFKSRESRRENQRFVFPRNGSHHRHWLLVMYRATSRLAYRSAETSSEYSRLDDIEHGVEVRKGDGEHQTSPCRMKRLQLVGGTVAYLSTEPSESPGPPEEGGNLPHTQREA